MPRSFRLRAFRGLKNFLGSGIRGFRDIGLRNDRVKGLERLESLGFLGFRDCTWRFLYTPRKSSPHEYSCLGEQPRLRTSDNPHE